GWKGNPEIDIQGNGFSIPSGDNSPSETDGTEFGYADKTGGTVVHTFTIGNSGFGNLTLNGTPTVLIEDLDSGDPPFAVTKQPATPVGPTKTTTFQITFDPAAYGLFGAKVTVENNDGDESNYWFHIRGNAGACMTVKGNDTEITDGDTSPTYEDHTDFGYVPLEGATQIRSFTIENTGEINLNLDGSPKVSLSGSHASDFRVTSDPVSPVSSGGGTTFQITFDPAVVGLRSASVSISNSDPDNNPYTFSIQGNGMIPPEMDVQGNGYSIDDGSGYSTHNGTGFGYVLIGTSATHTFTIQNTGSGDLLLTGSPKVSVSGTHASDFTVSVQPGSPVASGGGTTTFDVQFHPSAPGVRTASISISSNDTDENPYDIGLNGNGRIEVTFTHGADVSLDFMQIPPVPPVDNWPMGQFSLSASTDAILNYVIVNLDGTYSNLSGTKPFRIYASNINDFGTAAARGFDAAASGSTVTIEVGDLVPTSTRYYWMTVDLGEGAGGMISG
ncbi:MAG TPA: choice-of-anchor D domain-containing protein, partial [bacterium]